MNKASQKTVNAASHFGGGLLSLFVAMHEPLNLPHELEGALWQYRHRGRHAMHRHVELELNLITSGSGRYLLENRTYEIRRGDMLWLFPAQEHVLFEQSPEFEMWIIVFKPKAVKRMATEGRSKILRQKNPHGDFCRRLAQPELRQLELLFAEISAAAAQPALFNAGLGYALLSAWHHFEHAANVPVRDVHPAVEKAARIIQHERNTLGLNELARRSGLSSHRLSRLFKEQTGVALVEFRNRQRVETFLELYGTGQRRTMLDAALAAGFGSYAQFHRVFKRVRGCSPVEHRAK